MDMRNLCAEIVATVAPDWDYVAHAATVTDDQTLLQIKVSLQSVVNGEKQPPTIGCIVAQISFLPENF